jgi:hypothetical protein
MECLYSTGNLVNTLSPAWPMPMSPRRFKRTPYFKMRLLHSIRRYMKLSLRAQRLRHCKTQTYDSQKGTNPSGNDMSYPQSERVISQQLRALSLELNEPRIRCDNLQTLRLVDESVKLVMKLQDVNDPIFTTTDFDRSAPKGRMTSSLRGNNSRAV